MSAWSLLFSPAVLTIDLQSKQNAPLPPFSVETEKNPQLR
jgi:hypothetical protein